MSYSFRLTYLHKQTATPLFFGLWGPHQPSLCNLATYIEAVYNDNDGDIDKIAAALGGSGTPVRWKDGVTNEYIGDASRFAKLLVEGQLLWSERAPAIGGYAAGSPGAGSKSGGGGGKSSHK